MKKLHFSSFRIDLFIFILFLALYLGSRLFAIQTSLLYFNDMGRDSKVLLDWSTSHKPPLLGPQTSALPFNQSAFYFYTLFPAFLLTGSSPFAANIACAVYYLIIFAGLFWLLRKNSSLRRLFLFICWLVLIHPQFMIQNRFVWNPSLVGPMIVAAVMAFIALREKWERHWVVILGASLAFAIAYSYSSVPVAGVLLIASLLLWQREALWIWLSTFVAGIITNLPTFAFELRHNFLLTHQLLYGDRPPQPQLTVAHRVSDFVTHTLSLTQTPWQLLSVVMIVGAIGVVVWQLAHRRPRRLEHWQLCFILFLASAAFQLFTPIGVHAHYIFGPLVLLFATLAFLPSPAKYFLIGVLSLWWLVPMVRGEYFRPAQRTVAQMESCFERFCQQQTDPLFVSVQSDFHPFHNGPEHRFLMQKAGCQVKDIEADSTTAKTMAVVLDDSKYENGETSFNELTLFATPSARQEVGRFQCAPNFEIVVVGRK